MSSSLFPSSLLSSGEHSNPQLAGVREGERLPSQCEGEQDLEEAGGQRGLSGQILAVIETAVDQKSQTLSQF